MRNGALPCSLEGRVDNTLVGSAVDGGCVVALVGFCA